MIKNVLCVFGFMLLASVASAQAASSANTGDMGLGMKLESRLDAVSGHLSNLETDLAEVQAFRSAVTHCYSQQKFLKPSSSQADADGCVGARIENYNETVNVNVSAGGCGSGNYKVVYTIPEAHYSNIETATFRFDFRKLTIDLAILKGQPKNIYKKKKVQHGGWFGNDEHCKINVDYDGNGKISAKCHGDGAGRCRPNELEYFTYAGSRIVLGD